MARFRRRRATAYRSWHPAGNTLASAAVATASQKQCRSEASLALLASKHWLVPHGDVRLAVGPEGGFADEEVALAVAAGWHTVDLGPRILRVETAALFLAAVVASVPLSLWERGRG